MSSLQVLKDQSDVLAEETEEDDSLLLELALEVSVELVELVELDSEEEVDEPLALLDAPELARESLI